MERSGLASGTIMYLEGWRASMLKRTDAHIRATYDGEVDAVSVSMAPDERPGQPVELEVSTVSPGIYSYDEAGALRNLEVLYASKWMHLEVFPGAVAGGARSYVEARLPLYYDSVRDTAAVYFDEPSQVQLGNAVPSDVFPGRFVLDVKKRLQYMEIDEATRRLPPGLMARVRASAR